MARRTFTTVTIAGLAALVLGTAAASSAASLGGLTSQRLSAWVLPGGTGAPTVAAFDSFTRPGNTDLDGQATGGGGPAWQVVAGTWVTIGGAGRADSNTADAAVVTDCGVSEATSVVRLALLNGRFSAGLTLLQGSAGYLAVDYSSDDGMQLVRVLPGDRSVLTTASAARISPTTLSATYASGVVTVHLNGGLVLTHQLSDTDRALLGSNTGVGLYADADKQTRFDDFRCEH
jgi:hypothetical protein